MIDKDRIIRDQQKKIERIEKLQKELHAISLFGLVTLKVVGITDENGTLEVAMDAMHKLSHVIEDVLEGMEPKKAIKETMTSFEKDDEEED
ncbi:hypothetical protein ACMZ6Z_03360 [Streptococcus pluranimalium]|uniref:hypothetical protein n=1 Tax=Streptococcus pluranimalium TaxID=82348 RepID=UPI0039FCD6F5